MLWYDMNPVSLDRDAATGLAEEGRDPMASTPRADSKVVRLRESGAGGGSVRLRAVGAPEREHPRQRIADPALPGTPYLIAEIGINHNGSLDLARELIAAAHRAGFNAVKFQKRAIDRVYSQEILDKPRESPWGTTMRAQKEGIKFGYDDYCVIDRTCRELGIDWSASAWDLESQAFLRDFDVAFNKVASAMLGHEAFLRDVAAEGRKTFISTGMSTLEEIDATVAIFEEAECPFELMHCNSTYPLKEADVNLRCISMLRERYGCNVGYSGHETALIKVCVAAVALGATSIERHITLDRTMYGSDRAASVEVHALANFVDVMRTMPETLGTGEKAIT